MRPVCGRTPAIEESEGRKDERPGTHRGDTTRPWREGAHHVQGALVAVRCLFFGDVVFTGGEGEGGWHPPGTMSVSMTSGTSANGMSTLIDA